MQLSFRKLRLLSRQATLLLLGTVALALMPDSAQASCGDYLYKRKAASEAKQAMSDTSMGEHPQTECRDHTPPPLQGPKTPVRLQSNDEFASRIVNLRLVSSSNCWGPQDSEDSPRDGFRSLIERPPQG